ncbi:MAG TPA: hypothetical protein VNM48_22990 [Chloroflexota bacterium]|nr:hypothetical protein [Chloroflexota bacterium]
MKRTTVSLPDDLALVVAETAYLIASRLGPRAEAAFARGFGQYRH